MVFIYRKKKKGMKVGIKDERAPDEGSNGESIFNLGKFWHVN